MSRRRWIVLLGPPVLVAVVVPRLAAGTVLSPGVTPSVELRSIASCATATMPASRTVAAALPGTWWRAEPSIDASASLESWTLLVGAPGVPTGELRIAAASTVTGPVDGRVVVSSEGTASEDGSTVRIVDALSGCATEIPIGQRTVRRAVADPLGSGVLAHLLEPETRRDLGVWRIAIDGRIAERILEPVPDATLAAAGIDRVWATDLRLDAARRHLAVQSCHPDACVTRIVDLATGDLTVLDRGDQGPIVGFSGRGLVTWEACHGFPCPIVAWDPEGRFARTLAPEASGAALSGDGRQLVIERRGSAGERDLVSIDLRSGMSRRLGAAGADAIPLSGSAGMTAGLEVAGSSVPIGRDGRSPMPLVLEDAAGFAPPDREVQP